MPRRVAAAAIRPIVLYLHRWPGHHEGVSRYGQYCPITRSLEVLGDRWTLLVVRDLLVGATRFNELARGLPGMSRGLLSKRLDQLERDGLVVRADGGYQPTLACEELRPLIFGLAEWGARWAFGEPRPDELDPVVLMWWIRGGIDPDRLIGDAGAGTGGARRCCTCGCPTRAGPGSGSSSTPGDVSLCFTDPGFEVDVTLEAAAGRALPGLARHASTLPAAVRDGRVTLTGPREAVRRLPGALRLSPAAPYVAEAGPAPQRCDR